MKQLPFDEKLNIGWDSLTFENFRNRNSSCKECTRYSICNGGCGLELGINAGSYCTNNTMEDYKMSEAEKDRKGIRGFKTIEY